MHRFGSYQTGKTYLIDHPDLVRQFRKNAAGEPYDFETKRRERLGAQLAVIRRDLAARRIRIDVAHRELDDLPSTIRLAPCRLGIACTDAHDLLRQLMEIPGGRQRSWEVRGRGDHSKLTALLNRTPSVLQNGNILYRLVPIRQVWELPSCPSRQGVNLSVKSRSL